MKRRGLFVAALAALALPKAAIAPPRFARGGMVAPAVPCLIGEVGAETILPLTGRLMVTGIKPGVTITLPLRDPVEEALRHVARAEAALDAAQTCLAAAPVRHAADALRSGPAAAA